MKVLYLAPPRRRPDSITAMTFIDEELIALVERGVEAHVLSTSCRRREVVDGVHLRPVPPGRAATTVFRNSGFWLASRADLPLARRDLGRLYIAIRTEREAAVLCARERFDLIHSHFGAPAGFGGRLAAGRSGLPVVASLRGMDLLTDASLGYGLRLNRAYDRRIRELLGYAARTLYVSDHMRERGIDLGARPERAFTIRKGVDTSVFRPDRAPKRAPLEVLVVTNLLRRKRVDHLLRALATLPADVEFRLSVCGVGPEESYLRGLAAELGLGERTQFHGWVERSEVPGMFARAAVLVLPSVEEASGNVLLEAQASGTPAICMDSGGAPEYVQDGVTGYVVAPESIADLAERVRRVLEDAGLRQRLGAAARTYALSALRYECMINGILDAYAAVMRERTGGSPMPGLGPAIPESQEPHAVT